MALPLLELSPIVIALIALGLAIVTAAIIRATLGKLADAASLLPGIGGWLRGAIDSVAAAITSVLGKAESGVDHLIGTMFHLLAEQFNWLWREFKRHTLIGSLLATLVYAITHSLSYLRHHVADLQRLRTSISGRIKTLEKEWHGIESRVKSLERDWTKGIGHDLITHVRALEQTVGNVENRVIPSIRTAVNKAETDVTALRKWITDNVPVLGSAAFAGAVAAALSALGLSWLRCNSNPFNNNKNACGLWGDLANLLAIAVIAGEIASLDELIKVAQGVTGEIVQGVEELLQV